MKERVIVQRTVNDHGLAWFGKVDAVTGGDGGLCYAHGVE
jgi:hypothetical protein